MCLGAIERVWSSDAWSQLRCAFSSWPTRLGMERILPPLRGCLHTVFIWMVETTTSYGTDSPLCLRFSFCGPGRLSLTRWSWRGSESRVLFVVPNESWRPVWGYRQKHIMCAAYHFLFFLVWSMLTIIIITVLWRRTLSSLMFRHSFFYSNRALAKTGCLWHWRLPEVQSQPR